MKKSSNSIPIAGWVLIVLLFFIGVSALISGAMLFVAPDGHLMQWSTDQLKGSPFTNYLIPGLILFIFLGIFPIFVGFSLSKRPMWTWPNVINPAKKTHWAWTASWAVGVIMLIWITIETVFLGYVSFLQPFVAGYGIILIILTLLPNVRKFYKR
jgi:hypothetical protein